MEYNLTTAQKELLELLNQDNVNDYFEALKTVHYLATYCINEELVNLSASRSVQDLLDVIERITIENSLRQY